MVVRKPNNQQRQKQAHVDVPVPQERPTNAMDGDELAGDPLLGQEHGEAGLQAQRKEKCPPPHRWLKTPRRSKRMSCSMLQDNANVAAKSDRVEWSRVPARSRAACEALQRPVGVGAWEFGFEGRCQRIRSHALVGTAAAPSSM